MQQWFTAPLSTGFSLAGTLLGVLPEEERNGGNVHF